MKYFKILPAAAGVIALTATVAFARDMREREEGHALRIKVAAIDLAHSAGAGIPSEASGGEDAKHHYLVEVVRGNRKSIITIDASTGKILGRREIPV